MSELRVNNIVGEDGISTPTFTKGINITGVVTATTLNQVVSGVLTATSFSGPLTGNVTGDVTGTATTATSAASASKLIGIACTASKLGINTSSLNNTMLYLSGNAAAEIVTLTDGANIIPDFTSGNNFVVTLGGNRTLNNPTGVTTGQSGVIFVKQDGTGSRTLGIHSHYHFAGGTAPTFSTAANAVDVIGYVAYGATTIACTTTLDVKTTPQ